MRQYFSQLKQKMVDARQQIAYRASGPKRLLFDHLPKCAGTTIVDYLHAHYPKRHIFRTGRDPYASVAEFKAFSKHERYQRHLVMGHLAHHLLDDIHPDTLKLTILRDPVDRIISHYFFVKQNHEHPQHERVVKTGVSLEDYVLSGDWELNNWYVTHYSGLSGDEVIRRPDEALRMAEAALEKYDLIGFQDDLAGITETLRRIARLDRPFENKTINKTRQRSSVDDVPEGVRQVIAKANALDIRLCASLKKKHQME